MKIIAFILGIVVGIAAHWYYARPKGGSLEPSASEAVRSTARDARDDIKSTLTGEKIRTELAEKGQIIRERTREAGNALADATANARTTAAIKTKLLQENSLAALKINVDTTDGVVTLSGTVATHEEIGRAMEIAWETEGVYKVISTLQIKGEGTAKAD